MNKYEKISLEPEHKRARLAYKSAKRLRIKRRIPELEKYILENANLSVEYATTFIKDRWPEAEENIIKNADFQYLFNYCVYVIKDRWPEAEDRILKSPEFTYKYCEGVIEKRWDKAEDALINLEKNDIKDLWTGNCYVFRYWEEFIKTRWIEAEDLFIKNMDLMKGYADLLRTKLPEHMHNAMLCASLSSSEEDKEASQSYFESLKNWNTILVRQLKTFDENLSVAELIKSLEQ